MEQREREKDGLLRGSLRRGITMGVPTNGRHSAKIRASSYSLSERPQTAGVMESSSGAAATGRRTPLTERSQTIEEWKAATDSEMGKGAFNRFKEKVQVMAAKSAQLQVEKEIRAANEFRTKVNASVEEKLTDYTTQLQAANRNIAMVTAGLHSLSSAISEEKIKELLRGIVEPYFESLTTDTRGKLEDMDGRNRREEEERTKRFEKEMEENRRTLSELKAETKKMNEISERKTRELNEMAMNAATTTERQLSDLNNTFQSIKEFTDSIPATARATQEAAEIASQKLVQSAESTAKQLVQAADDSNRAETLALNQFRAAELQKLESSLQSIGQNAISTVRSDLEDLTSSLKSSAGEQVDNINTAVTRGKVHVEHIQDSVSRVDRNLEKSFEHLSSEIKALNEEVTETMHKTNEASKNGRETIQRLGNEMNDARGVVDTAESTLKSVQVNMEQLNDKVRLNGEAVLEKFEGGFQKLKSESGVFFDEYIETIEVKGKEAGESMAMKLESSAREAGASIEEDFGRMKRDSGVFLDDYIAQFEGRTTKAGANVATLLESSAIQAGILLDDQMEKFEETSARAGETVVRVLENSTKEAGVSLENDFGRMKRDSGVFFDERMEQFQQHTAKAGETITAVITKSSDETLEDFEKGLEKLKTAGEISVRGFVANIGDESSEACERISKVFETSTQGVEESLKTYAKQVRDVTTQGGKMITDSLEESKQEVGKAAKEFTKNVQEASTHGSNIIANSLEISTKQTESSLNDFIEKMSSESTQVRTVIESSFAKLAKETEGSLENYIEKVQNSTAQGGKTIEDAFGKSWQENAQLVDAYTEKIQHATSLSEKTLEETFSKSTQENAQSLSAYVETIKSETSLGRGAFEKVMQENAQSMVTFAEKIKSETHRGTGAITATFEKLAAETGGSVEAYLHKVRHVTTEGGETVAGALENLTRQTGESMDRIQHESAALGETISATFQAATEKTHDSMNGYVQQIEAVGTKCGASLEQLTKQTGQSMEGLVDRLQLETVQAGEKISAATQKTQDSVNEYVRQVEAVSSKTLETISNTFQTGTESTQKSITEYVQQIETVGTKVADRLETSMKQTAESMDGAVDRIQCETTKAGQTISAQLSTATDKTEVSIKEYVQQIGSMSTKAAETLSAALKNATDHTDESFGEHIHRIEAVTTKYTEATSAIGAKIEETTKASSDHLESMIQKTRHESVQASEAISTALKTATDETGSSIISYAQQIEAVTTKSADSFSAIGETIQKSTKDSEMRLSITAKKMKRETIQAAEVLSSILKTVTDSAQSSINDSAQKFENIGIKAVDSISNIGARIEGINKDSGEQFDNIVSKLHLETAQASDVIANAFEINVKKTDKALSEHAEHIERATVTAGATVLGVEQNLEKLSRDSVERLEGAATKIHLGAIEADEAISKTFRTSTETLQSSLDEHVQNIEKVNEIASGTILSVARGLEKTKIDTGEYLNEFIDKIQLQSTEVAAAISVSFESNILRTQSSVDAYVERVEGVNARSEETVSMLALRIDNTFESNAAKTQLSLDTYAGQVEEVHTKAERTLSSLMLGIENATSETGARLNSFIDKLHSEATQAEESIATALGNNLTTTQTSLNAFVERVEGQVGEQLNVFHRQISEANDTLASTFESSITKTQSSLETHLSNVESVIQQETQTFTETTKCFGAYVERIESISSHTESTLTTITGGLATAQSITSESLNSYVETIRSVSTKAGETVSCLIPQLQGAIEKSLSQHESTVTTLNSSLLTTHSDLTNTIKTDMISWTETQTTSTKDFISRQANLDAEMHATRETALKTWEERNRLELEAALGKWNGANDDKIRVVLESFQQYLEVHGEKLASVLGVPPLGKTISTIAEDNSRSLAAIAQAFGTPAADSTLCKMVVEISEAQRKEQTLHHSLEKMMQESMGFVSSAKEALGTTSVSLKQITESSSEMNGSTISSWTVAEDSNQLISELQLNLQSAVEALKDSKLESKKVEEALSTTSTSLKHITESSSELSGSMAATWTVAKDSSKFIGEFSSNLQSTVQSLKDCKIESVRIGETIKEAQGLAKAGTQSAKEEKLAASEMQTVMQDNSASLSQLIEATSDLTAAFQTSRETAEHVTMDMNSFTGTIAATTRTIRGTIDSTNQYQEDVMSIGTEFETATESLRRMTNSIHSFREKIAESTAKTNDRTVGAVVEITGTVRDLTEEIANAEEAITEFTASLPAPPIEPMEEDNDASSVLADIEDLIKGKGKEVVAFEDKNPVYDSILASEIPDVVGNEGLPTSPGPMPPTNEASGSNTPGNLAKPDLDSTPDDTTQADGLNIHIVEQSDEADENKTKGKEPITPTQSPGLLDQGVPPSPPCIRHRTLGSFFLSRWKSMKENSLTPAGEGSYVPSKEINKDPIITPKTTFAETAVTRSVSLGGGSEEVIAGPSTPKRQLSFSGNLSDAGSIRSGSVNSKRRSVIQQRSEQVVENRSATWEEILSSSLAGDQPLMF